MGKRIRSSEAAKRVDGCDECGEAHRMTDGSPGCTAHRSNSGRSVRCKARPVNGSPVCKTHGGIARQTKEKGLERIQFAQVEGEIATLLRQVDMPDQHPIDGLLEWVRHSSAMYRMLGHLVAQLKQDPSINTYVVETKDGGTRVEKVASEDGLWGVTHTGDPAPHVLVTLYRQWGETAAKAMKLALDANIDERLVRNAEATSDIMFTALSKALRVLDLTPEQQALFTETLAGELRTFAGPGALEAS